MVLKEMRKKMLKAYKYRLYPTADQRQQLENFFGATRYIYNLALETKTTAYKSAGVSLSAYDLSKQLTDLKKDPAAAWLNEVPAISLIWSLNNLDRAYKNFFRELKKGKAAGFPKFKRKSGHQSFQFHQGYKIDSAAGLLHAPKMKNIPIIIHRPFAGTTKTVTVSKTPSGRYYASILCEDEEQLPVPVAIKEDTAVGIDLGVKDAVILSTGEKYANKRFLEASRRRLRIAQRSLARKVKGSNRWKKQKLVVAGINEKISNQRADHLHKVSYAITKRFDTVCLEDLNVKGMSASAAGNAEKPGKMVKQKSGLNRAILDTSFGELRRMLEYKSAWQGKNLVVISRWAPTSKTCSSCGHQLEEMKLTTRDWDCPTCVDHHDRDINAAKNILAAGLKQKGEEVLLNKVA